MRLSLNTIYLSALLAVLALLASSCAPQKALLSPASAPPSQPTKNSPAPLPTKNSSAPLPIKISSAQQHNQEDQKDALVRKQEKLMSQGDYLAALSLAGDNTKVGSSAILSRALPGAYGQGKQMLEDQHYAEAGATFAYLLSLANGRKAILAGDEVSIEELARQRDLCAEQLMVQGMTAYRSGLLEEAIGTWEQILAFAPEHEGAQKSLSTSRTQLSNLKALVKE